VIAVTEAGVKSAVIDAGADTTATAITELD
jgi:hypothetical protein